jgi:hypothetical protein
MTNINNTHGLEDIGVPFLPFSDKETLLDALTELEDATVTKAFEQIKSPIRSSSLTEDEADEKIADSLLAQFEEFIIVKNGDRYNFFGIRMDSKVLLAFV